MLDNELATDDESDEQPPAGPGAVLREARVARGVAIEEIATDLRIELRLLHAIENENYAALGAPVFAKGYIRQYAGRLGVDPVPLVAQYNALIGDSDVRIEPSRVIRLRDTQQITIWVVAALALALVVVFLLLWWYNTPTAVRTPAAASQPAPASLPFPDVAADPQPADAAGGAAAAGGPGSEPGAVPAAPGGAGLPGGQPVDAGGVAADEAAASDADAPPAAPAAGQAGDAGSLAGAAGSSAGAANTAAPAPGGGSPAAATSAGPAGIQPVAAAGPAVEFVFLEECWTEVTDAAGQQLLYGLIQPGTTHIVHGVLPLDVFLGNATAAEIRIDGREFTVPRTGRRGNLARFAIDAPTN